MGTSTFFPSTVTVIFCIVIDLLKNQACLAIEVTEPTERKL
jgi:hypothetical protein